MKNNLKLLLAALFIGSSVSLASCGGEYGGNNDMPPESLEGNTQETGVPGTGTSDTLKTNSFGGADPDSARTDSTNLGTTTPQ